MTAQSDTEFTTKLLEMIQKFFPELTIIDTKLSYKKVLIPQYYIIRYNNVNLISFSENNIYCYDTLELLSEEDIFKKTKLYHEAMKYNQEKMITGTSIIKKVLSIEEYKTVLRNLIDQYHKLEKVKKEYNVEKKIEEIKNDFN